MTLSLAFVLLAVAHQALGWNVFKVPHTAGGDDTPALLTALAAGDITANATILFEKGVTYNIFTPITFPVLNNVEVAIEGNLTYPEDIPTVQSRFLSHLISTSLKGITDRLVF